MTKEISVNRGRKEKWGVDPPHPPLIDSCFVIWDKFNIVVWHTVKKHASYYTHVFYDVVLPQC